MASTYENDLRLEEMATGENSGSWGTKTNTNLELIADAFSYGTETIANADTTITIADGAADAARSLALKINSSEDLTTTRVVTLAPNTTSKVWIIENNTSGGQTLTISAGSGSNVTLANGTTKIIATDGIGAGSNVVELTQDLAIADMSVDGILSLADGSNSAPSLTNTGDTNTGLYFPAADEVGITTGGTQRVKVDSTGVDITGTLVSDGLTVDKTATISTTDYYASSTFSSTLKGAANNTKAALLLNSVSSSGQNAFASIHSEPIADFRASLIGTYSADGSGAGHFSVKQFLPTSSTTLERMRIDQNGDITFYDTDGTTASFVYDASAGTTFNEAGADRDFRVESDGNTHALFVDAGNNRVGILDSSPSHGFTINTATAVKGGSRVNLYTATNGNYGYIQNTGASTSNVVTLAANGKVLTVDDQYDAKIFNSAGNATYNWDTSAAIFEIKRANGTFAGTDTTKIDMWHYDDTGNPTAQILVGGTTNYTGDMVFKARGGGTSGGGGASLYEYMRLRGNERELVINQDGLDHDFRVESNTQTHMLFVDAGNDRVGINSSAPSTLFSVNVDGAVGNLGGQDWNADKWLVVSDGAGVSASGFGITHTETYGTLIASIDPFTAWRAIEMQGDEFRYMYTGNNELLTINGNEVVINEGSANTDFRIESDSNTHMLFVDASNNLVSVGSSVPSYGSKFNVSSGTNTLAASFESALGGAGAACSIRLGVSTRSSQGLQLSSVGSGGSILGGSLAAAIYNTEAAQLALGGNNVYNQLILDSDEIVINEGSANTDFRVESDSNANMFFVDASANSVLFGNTGGSSGTMVRINHDVDGGETAAALHIQGAGYTGFHWLDSTGYYIGQNSTIRQMRIYSGAETAGVALTNGATSWGTFSDERLKENVEPIENALQSLSGLRTVKYHLKDLDGPEDKKKIGVIAQDLVGVLDEVIDPTFRPDDDTEYMGVRYTELVPVLIKAIQEQQTLIEALTARITALETP